MSSPLDRIEAQVQEEIGHRVSGGMYRTEDVLALVNVAKAAEAFLDDDDVRGDWGDCECSYCVKYRALREALAALKEPA